MVGEAYIVKLVGGTASCGRANLHRIQLAESRKRDCSVQYGSEVFFVFAFVYWQGEAPEGICPSMRAVAARAVPWLCGSGPTVQCEPGFPPRHAWN